MSFLSVVIAPDGTNKIRDRTEFKVLLEIFSGKFPDSEIVVHCDEAGTDTTAARGHSAERQSSKI